MLRNSASGPEIGLPGLFRQESSSVSLKLGIWLAEGRPEGRFKGFPDCNPAEISSPEAQFPARKHYRVTWVTDNTSLAQISSPTRSHFCSMQRGHALDCWHVAVLDLQGALSDAFSWAQPVVGRFLCSLKAFCCVPYVMQ